MNIIDAANPTVSGLIDAGSGATVNAIRDLLPSEDFSVIVKPQTLVISSGGSTQEVVEDVNLNVYTSATIWNWNNLRPLIPLNGYATGPAQYTSSNPSVATVTANNGTVTPVSVGDTAITVYVPGLGTRVYDDPVSQTGDQTTTTWDNFVSGSLGAYLTTTIDGLINGLTPPSFVGSPPYAWSSLVNLFNTDGTRNTGGWWGSNDTTCIPQSIGCNGVLITPRDMLFANHYGATNPTFVDNAGNVYNRTIAATRTLTSPSGDGGDILVATLNADLPEGVIPATILPANFRNYLPQPVYGYPAVFTNQDRALLIGSLQNTAPPDLAIGAPLNPLQAGWWYQVRTYDSGSPAGIFIGGKFCLLTQWHFISAGPIDSDNISQINAAITANGSPYALATTDLSTYTSY